MAELNRAHAVLGCSIEKHPNLFDEAISTLGMRIDVPSDAATRIPELGPCIVISNHPFGGVGGLALGATMLRCRSDARILANSVLSRITKLRPWFLDVEVFDSQRQASKNARQLCTALTRLETGGMLIVLPAGEVSHFQPRRRKVSDDDWSRSAAVLARRSGADVLPCFFKGENRSH